MKKISTICICLVLLLTTACSPIEKQAYNTIVGAKAFLDKEKSQHPECASNTPSAVCDLLVKATSAKDALITATEAYCSGPEFESGGTCQAPAKGNPARATLESKLKAALQYYDQMEKDLKGAIK